MALVVARWGEVVRSEPELAEFARGRLDAAPAYLATARADGTPRVHPVTPIITADGLYVFMEPTSPKGADLRVRRAFALHAAVPDSVGSGGELAVRGEGRPEEEAAARAAVVGTASYEPEERYVLFELLVAEVRANGYGDVALPATLRWRAGG